MQKQWQIFKFVSQKQNWKFFNIVFVFPKTKAISENRPHPMTFNIYEVQRWLLQQQKEYTLDQELSHHLWAPKVGNDNSGGVRLL